MTDDELLIEVVRLSRLVSSHALETGRPSHLAAGSVLMTLSVALSCAEHVPEMLLDLNRGASLALAEHGATALRRSAAWEILRSRGCEET